MLFQDRDMFEMKGGNRDREVRLEGDSFPPAASRLVKERNDWKRCCVSDKENVDLGLDNLRHVSHASDVSGVIQAKNVNHVTCINNVSNEKIVNNEKNRSIDKNVSDEENVRQVNSVCNVNDANRVEKVSQVSNVSNGNNVNHRNIVRDVNKVSEENRVAYTSDVNTEEKLEPDFKVGKYIVYYCNMLFAHGIAFLQHFLFSFNIILI